MKSKTKDSYLGKYGEIILAVAFFLVFDMAVLVLNFYISYEISKDAFSINMAGRQRMLSQRMTKALLTAESDIGRGMPANDSLEELKKTTHLFDTTLHGFRDGGIVMGGDDHEHPLEPVKTEAGRSLLTDAELIWNPYQQLLAPLTANSFSTEQMAAAEDYARKNNLKLLKLMNGLTTELEKNAGAKADTLRKVQMGGMMLALLNFAFILFKFIRRLRENDRKLEVARQETSEILTTVKDGLFLLDAEFKLGSQFSESMPHILGRKVSPQMDFRDLLGDMVSPQTLELATDYIALLFSDSVTESLMGDLNPLTSLEIVVRNERDEPSRRFLNMQFNRVLEDGKISHLLVTLIDITAQVELEQALVDVRKTAKAEMEIMLDLLKVNPMTLEQFLKNSETSLLEVNDRLRSVSSGNQRNMVTVIFRKIHAMKGEAAALGLEIFESQAQQFEEHLSRLLSKGDVSGEDLLALPLPLEEMLQRITMVRGLVERLAAYHDAFAPAMSQSEGEEFANNLNTLTKRIADDHGKSVHLFADIAELDKLSPNIKTELKDITVQLLRNAIAHGIEPADERTTLAKPPVGNIYLAIKPMEPGEFELTVRDDGRGLSPEKIKNALIRTQRYTESQLSEFSDKQILMKIFEPGFSTLEKASRDAGHGIGMDVVKHKIEQLGARLHIRSQINGYTQFSIQFSAFGG
ncbi:MAG TPA: ATP-binding protein [Methylophilaceae bacterium]|jgi:signal transduction histidine kinase